MTDLLLVLAANSTDGEPTANGRAAQAKARAVAVPHDTFDLCLLHCLLLALTTQHEAARSFEMSNRLACTNSGVQGSNV